MSSPPRFLAWSVSVGLLACGSSGGARYSGVREAPLVRPENVEVAQAIPPGYNRLGRVFTRCRVVEGFQELDEQPFADLDCTRARLIRALQESSAEAGGELLVGLRCREEGTSLRCDAVVARPDDEALSRRSPAAAKPQPTLPPTPAEVALLDEPRVSPSFDILMSFQPKQRFERAPVEPIEVDRVGALPPHHLDLGDLEARCEKDECEPGELVRALRVTAARFGVTSLAAVRCSTVDDEAICVGTLGATPLDPALETAAR